VDHVTCTMARRAVTIHPVVVATMRHYGVRMAVLLDVIDLIVVPIPLVINVSFPLK
jgi:hypothetical protein